MDCPKCGFTMEYLSDSPLLDRDFDVSTTDGIGAFGRSYRRTLNTLSLPDLLDSLFGRMKNRRFHKTVEEYPRTLICPQCEWLVKQK